MDDLTNWQVWAAVMFVAALLEFAIGGVGILAVLSVAAGLMTLLILGLGAFGIVIGWKAALFAFAVAIVVAVGAVMTVRRLVVGNKANDVDINTY